MLPGKKGMGQECRVQVSKGKSAGKKCAYGTRVQGACVQGKKCREKPCIEQKFREHECRGE
jgi:hypothetical protein